MMQADHQPLPPHLRDFIDRCTWVFAKTYANTWPHEYIVREKVDETSFVELVMHIRAHGYEGRFYEKPITYFDHGGMVYWTMGSPIEKTTIVNRCKNDQTYEYRLKHGTMPENRKDLEETKEAERKIRVEAVHTAIPSTVPRFTAIVNDWLGLDAAPCSLLFQLGSLYFPDCSVAVTNLTTGEKGILGDIFSLMMLAAGTSNRLEFRCITTPELFDRLNRCACLLYLVNEARPSHDEYEECSKVLEKHSRDGHLKLEEALLGSMEAGGRTTMLREAAP